MLNLLHDLIISMMTTIKQIAQCCGSAGFPFHWYTSLAVIQHIFNVQYSRLTAPDHNEWVANCRIPVFTQRFLGWPRGKHCNSLFHQWTMFIRKKRKFLFKQPWNTPPMIQNEVKFGDPNSMYSAHIFTQSKVMISLITSLKLSIPLLQKFSRKTRFTNFLFNHVSEFY